MADVLERRTCFDDAFEPTDEFDGVGEGARREDLGRPDGWSEFLSAAGYDWVWTRGAELRGEEGRDNVSSGGSDFDRWRLSFLDGGLKALSSVSFPGNVGCR